MDDALRQSYDTPPQSKKGEVCTPPLPLSFDVQTLDQASEAGSTLKPGPIVDDRVMRFT